ncbi:MAG: chromate efflux transporter [Phycisphaerales bacterium]|nr:chromate efflux transporter [Phycisphaerales bacterium]
MGPGSAPPQVPPDTRSSRLRELALVFLKLGTVSFGGPAAHTALMEEECVRRRNWLGRRDFLDLVSATNLIPGPNSTELAIHIGHRRAGVAGLLVAGSCFILPATLIVLCCAWVYVRVGTLPQLAGALYGVKPVVVAIIALALVRFARTALHGPRLLILGVAALAAVCGGLHELLVLGTAGLLAAVLPPTRGLPPRAGAAVVLLGALPTPRATAAAAGLLATTTTATTFGLLPLFLFFAKVGSVLFGSGYVLLAFLQSDLVDRWQWLSTEELLDAVAIGQVTPGPLFTTATFIGYVLAGVPGAAVATVGIFLPAFVFVAVSAPFIPRLRQSQRLGRALDGLNVASLALMFAVSWQLACASVVDLLTLGLAVGAGVVLARRWLGSACLVLAGGLFGAGLGHFGWAG